MAVFRLTLAIFLVLVHFTTFITGQKATPAPQGSTAAASASNGDSVLFERDGGSGSGDGASVVLLDVLEKALSGDSPVCKAAIHDGRIPDDGGRVGVYRWSGQVSYEGSTQNGITSDRKYNSLTCGHNNYHRDNIITSGHYHYNCDNTIAD
uniref:LCCL domain-containing protein n=1 Tax=Branchiostoma floridae TaxID=7739 RepID=C3XPK4_BRAFL|eukprot:XP_002613866.1 hypothetical protein BRAFLDRAFT_72014 [Branchiostoma floridae]